MTTCDFSCGLDGFCEPLCASPLNLCSIDEDCLLGLDEARSLQTVGFLFRRGLNICCWTTIIMGILCGLLCFVLCMRVDNSGAPKINWERLDWARSGLRSIKIGRPRSSSLSQPEENDIEHYTDRNTKSNYGADQKQLKSHEQDLSPEIVSFEVQPKASDPSNDQTNKLIESAVEL